MPLKIKKGEGPSLKKTQRDIVTKCNCNTICSIIKDIIDSICKTVLWMIDQIKGFYQCYIYWNHNYTVFKKETVLIFITYTLKH